MNVTGFIVDWILARAVEPSTWHGLIALATGAGILVSPHNAGIIVAAGASISGSILVVRKDPKNIPADIEAVAAAVVPIIAAINAKDTTPAK